MTPRELVRPGRFHRLAIAVGPGGSPRSWLVDLVGARPMLDPLFQPHGFAMGPAEVSADSGAWSELLWLGGVPLCLLHATAPDGQLGRYVRRHGWRILTAPEALTGLQVEWVGSADLAPVSA